MCVGGWVRSIRTSDSRGCGLGDKAEDGDKVKGDKWKRRKEESDGGGEKHLKDEAVGVNTITRLCN